MTTPARPPANAFAVQARAMQVALPTSQLRASYDDLSSAAGHLKTLFNNLAFARQPTFTWLSVEHTLLPVYKMKRDACRQLAQSLWSEGRIHLIKPPGGGPGTTDDDPPVSLMKEPVIQSTPKPITPTAETAQARGHNLSSDYGGFPDVADIEDAEPIMSPTTAPSKKRTTLEPVETTKKQKTKNTAQTPKTLSKAPPKDNRSIREFFSSVTTFVPRSVTQSTKKRSERPVAPCIDLSSDAAYYTAQEYMSSPVVKKPLHTAPSATTPMPTTHAPETRSMTIKRNATRVDHAHRLTAVDDASVPPTTSSSQSVKPVAEGIPAVSFPSVRPISTSSVSPMPASSRSAHRHRPVIHSDSDTDDQMPQPEDLEALPMPSSGLMWAIGSSVNMVVRGTDMKADLRFKRVTVSGLIRLKLGLDATSASAMWKEMRESIVLRAGPDKVNRVGPIHWLDVEETRYWVNLWGFEPDMKCFLSWVDGTIDLDPITNALACSRCGSELRTGHNNGITTLRKHLASHLGTTTFEGVLGAVVCHGCSHVFITPDEFEKHICPGY